MKEEKKSIGALWKNKSQKGDTYLSGSIEIGKEKIDIIVFKNNYKEQEKHPDYKIYLKTKQEAKEENTNEKIDKEFVDFGNTVELTDEDIDSELAF